MKAELNRLKNQRCYLIGPIDRSPDMGIRWRKKISEQLLAMGVVVYNPLDRPMTTQLETQSQFARRKAHKQNRDYAYVINEMKRIRHEDLRMVDRSDFCIFNLDLTQSPVGSWEEFFWANRCKKPILTFLDGGLQNLPDWLFGTIPTQYVFSNATQLLSLLTEINSDPDWVDETKRWVLFN